MAERVRRTERDNQKERTRAAIVDAARELVDTGDEVTMPLVAGAARVSEATAYRYFPDLVSLLGEVASRLDVDVVMAGVDGSNDPVERVGHVADVLVRSVVLRQGAIRALIAATIARPRPGVHPRHRFQLIERALAPWSSTVSNRAVEELTHALAVVISAEALFSLVDQCGLSTGEAVASIVRTARAVTAAAVAAAEV